MSKKLHILITVLFIFIFTSVSVADKADYKEGELLVRFAPKENKQQKTKSEKEEILASIDGGTIKRSHERLVPGLNLVKLPEGVTVENALEIFRKTEGILYAEPNHKIKSAAMSAGNENKMAAMEPNDPNFSQQWGLYKISAPAAWEIRTNASNVIVAVIDTGVDYTHEDLRDNMWKDTDGSFGYDFADDDNDPMDVFDRYGGTDIAGIIGAVGDNNLGVTGVCWKVKIMALKIFDSKGEGDIDGVIDAITYAIDKGAKVLHTSYENTDGYTDSERDAIEAADANGQLFIAMAGNSSFGDGNNIDLLPFYPASYDCNNIIVTMATYEDDTKPQYEFYGPVSVDLAAPYEGFTCRRGGGYEYAGCSAFAASYVSGAAALLWAKFPYLTNLQVKEKILDSADVIPALNGLCVTGGRLNLHDMFYGWKANANAVKVSAGSDHSLVLTQDKSAFGTGENGYYQLGIGYTTVDPLTFTRVHDPNNVGFLKNISDIAAGYSHSLFLDVNNFVWATGDNREGQLGDNSQYATTTPIHVHGPNNVGYLHNIISISASKFGGTYPSWGMHSLAADVNGLCLAWGLGNKGQLGQGSDRNNKLTPVKVKSGEMGGAYLHDIIAVSAGENQSMALDSNGFVWTWGLNYYDNREGWSAYGRLGIGSAQDYNDTPFKVHGGQMGTQFLQNIVAISAGWNHCMALEKNWPFEPNCLGRVYTWGWGGGTGYSDGGRLGNGRMDNNSTPVIVKAGAQDPNNPNGELKGIVAIAASEDHSMALTEYGEVFCWGDNTYGQLGNGTNDPCTTPVKVVGKDGNGYLQNIVAISAGLFYSLAVDSDGTVWSWGHHDDGRLGLGNIGSIVGYVVNTPHPIPVAYNLKQHKFDFSLKRLVSDANSSDTIELQPLTYYENDIYSQNKSLTISSADPFNSDIMESTIIDGCGTGTTIVAFESNPYSKLMGLTIANGGGIDCNSSSIQINRCIVRDNLYSGICCKNSSLAVWRSNIRNNGSSGNTLSSMTGICCEDSEPNIAECLIEGNESCGLFGGDSQAYVRNSIIRGNGDGGIYLKNLSKDIMPVIKNNWICDNDADEDGPFYPFSGCGVYLNLWDFNEPFTFSVAHIINNTIANNAVYGVKTNEYNPDDSNDAYIENCIVWGNQGGQLYNCTASYSCIQNIGSNNNHNINTNPGFVDDANGNYHIGPDSPCIDEGNTVLITDPNETDIDGEERVVDGDGDDVAIVDMGADEFYHCPADFDGNNIVNFADFAIFANAWRTAEREPNYNDLCDLVNDDQIDYNDLRLFCEDWLWQPLWPQEMGEGWLMGGEGDSLTEGASASVSAEFAEQAEPIVSPEDIKEMVNWLDEIWNAGDLNGTMTEQDYLEFRQAIESTLEQQ